MSERGGAEYCAWVKEIKRRTGNKCQFCGREDKLHAHHIFPISKFPKLATDLSNGMCLCNQCHDLVHGGKFKWKK